MSTQSQQLMANEIAQLKAENRQLRDQVHRYREFMAALSELDRTANRVQSDQELFALLNRILIDGLAIVNAQDGTLALLDDETAELKFVLVHGKAAPTLQGYRMPSNEGVMGWVVAHQETVRIENAHRDARFWSQIDQITGFSTHSILAAPLIGDERVLGVVEIINKRGDEPFDEVDEALITVFCRFAGQALIGLDRSLPTSE
jgi:GAF domain-containing protein